MTVIAVGLFENKKIMVADAKTITALKDKNQILSRIIVKIHKVNDIPTFIAFMGDEQVVHAFDYLNSFLNNKNKTIDLTNKDHIRDLLQTTMYVREGAKTIFKDLKLEAPMIIVMNKDTAFFWDCKVLEGKYVCNDEFERIGNNTLLVFYADERIHIDAEKYNSGNIRLNVLEAIEQIHKMKKSVGRSLSYDFDNLFTSVEIDNLTSNVIVQFPYDDLSSNILGYYDKSIIEKSAFGLWSPNLDNYK